MSDVFFPPPRFTTSTAPKATSGVHATITHPPPATAALATGSIVRGTVIGTDAKGQVLVKTDSGVLPLQTKAQLAQGSQVTLQVRIAGSELHVVILNVEAGQEAPRRHGGQPGPQESPQGRAQAGPAGAAPTALTDEDVASGRLIRAILEPAAAQTRAPGVTGGIQSGPGAGPPAGGESLAWRHDQRAAVVTLQGQRAGEASQAGRLQIHPCEHREDSFCAAAGRDVDAPNGRMCQRRAQEVADRLTGEIDVVRVAAAPGQEARVLAARHGLPDRLLGRRADAFAG